MSNSLPLAGTAFNTLGLAGVASYQLKKNGASDKSIADISNKISILTRNINMLYLAFKDRLNFKGVDKPDCDQVVLLSNKVDKMEAEINEFKIILGLTDS